jgi:hypothetical protein
MSNLGSNAEAYQVLVDLVVTIRRIVHRGLEKVSGKTWYLDGCPAGLFERLVDRKERETAIDRFSSEYQELITFASLDDLAAIVEFNQDLNRLLASLAPEGAPVIERLREIEALRLKLAASVTLDDEDLESLYRYHQEFKDALARRKKAAQETPPPAAPAAAEMVAASPQGELRSSTDAGPIAAGTVAPSTEGEDAVTPMEVAGPEFRTQAVSFEELVEVVEATKAEAGKQSGQSGSEPVPDPSSTAVAPPGSPPAEPAEPEPPTAVEAERAMAAEDDREVLGLLHREVTAVAGAAFRNHVDRPHPVWEAVRSSGWYDLKKADLALAPLELFFSIVGRAAEAQRGGAEPEAVKAMLHEAGFAKLLLSLREMFMRHTA